MNRPVLIVGGGPAGLSAGIQLKRAGVPVILFESKRLAHQVHQAHCIENVLGFSRISGANLARRLGAQVAHWKLPIRFEQVITVSKNKEGFSVRTPTQVTEGREIILATGTVPKALSLPGVEALKGRFVFDHVTDVVRRAPGHVVIVGAGDIAFDAALRLAEQHQVSILMKDQASSALPLLVQRVTAQPNIRLVRSCVVKQVRCLGQRIEIGLQGTETAVLCDYVLISIGRSPQYPQLDFPIRHELSAAPGCYLVGDVVQGKYRQIGIAMGDGLKAAMMILDQRRSQHQQHHEKRQQDHASKS